MAEPKIDAYNCAEIDLMMAELKDEMLDNISKQIKMANGQPAIDIDDASLYMEVLSVK